MLKLLQSCFAYLSKCFLILIISLLVTTVCLSESVTPTFGFEQNTGNWHHSLLVYNKAFAERFGLDEKKAIPLSKGLLAMQVIVEKSPKYPPFSTFGNDNVYDCHLNLFVDSHLAIRYPDNLPYSTRKAEAGVAGLISSALPNMNPNERQALWGIDDNYNGVTIGIFYKRLNKKGLILPRFVSWGVYDGYAQHILKGISYIRMNPSCGSISVMNKQTSLWLKKKNYKQYEQVINQQYKLDMNAYYHFSVPLAINQWPYVGYADCVNFVKVKKDAHQNEPNFKSKKCSM